MHALVGSSSLRLRLAVIIAACLLSVAALGLVGLALVLGATASHAGGTATTLFYAAGPGLADAIEVVAIGPTIETTALGLASADLPLAVAVSWLVLVLPSAAVAWHVAGRLVRPIDRAVDELVAGFEVRELDRRRLVDDAAHEVRNPLAVMRTNLEVALNEGDVGTLVAAAEVSQRAGERIARTIEDLRAEFQEGARQATRTPVELGRLVREVGREYQLPADRRGVAIHVDAPDGLVVNADREALKGAISNLVANALRFAPPGSPLHIAAGQRDGWHWLGVRDFGAGMVAQDQALVFRRAWRGGGQDGDGGAGIGLALVRQVAEAHGGSVRLTSRPRAGSSFVIWLPGRDEERGLARQPDASFDPLWEAAPVPAQG
jgi:signal transduction histidine kinase